MTTKEAAMCPIAVLRDVTDPICIERAYSSTVENADETCQNAWLQPNPEGPGEAFEAPVGREIAEAVIGHGVPGLLPTVHFNDQPGSDQASEHLEGPRVGHVPLPDDRRDADPLSVAVRMGGCGQQVCDDPFPRPVPQLGAPWRYGILELQYRTAPVLPRDDDPTTLVSWLGRLALTSDSFEAMLGQ